MAGAISGGPISGSLTVRDAAALWVCDVPDVVHAIPCDVARLGVLGPGIQRLALIGPLLRAIITDMNSGRLNSGDVAISSATLIRRTASVHCADMLVPAGPVPCATLRGSAQQNSLNNSLPVACCLGCSRVARAHHGGDLRGLGHSPMAGSSFLRNPIALSPGNDKGDREDREGKS